MDKTFNTSTITITTTEEDENRIINSTVFFNPLVPSDDHDDYKCQAFIGNRIFDRIESDNISLDVKCESKRVNLSVCLSVFLSNM